jgi:hypothetical protein
MVECQLKGIFCNCDEKKKFGHKCKEQKLFMAISEDVPKYDVTVPLVEEPSLHDATQEPADPSEVDPLISLHSIIGFSTPGYSWHNDELCYKVHLYLSKQSQLKSTMLYALHATPTTRHSRFTKTYDKVKHSFWGDGMKRDAHTFVPECDVCQRNKGKTIKPPGTLQALPICWLWSLIIFLIQRSLFSVMFIPHEDFTPQKNVHSSTQGSVEGGYPLCGGLGVRGKQSP